MSQDENSISQELKNHAMILGGLVAFLWILEFVDLFIFRGRLNAFGIRPRSPNGLQGILFAPFLHGNFRHLMGNTVPFLVLGWFVMLRETSDFWIVSAIAMLTSGLGTWFFGQPYTVHIGASGVIFGYFGYLLLRGWFERSFQAIFFALIVGALYGSLIWGVFPTSYRISWEGHLFGFIGGGLAAWLLSRRPTQPD